MVNINSTIVELFKAKAAPVSTIVAEVENLSGAIKYALDVCEKKSLRQFLLAGDEGQNSGAKKAETKVLAAPELPGEAFAELERLGQEKGFIVIKDGLRAYLSGIDVGFTLADRAVAETATAVMACQNEDTRLATMICETHVLALPKSKIVKTSYEIEDYLQQIMGGVMYTAFISGCSRTSDIERVLTLGVHGPLELHVTLMEE